MYLKRLTSCYKCSFKLTHGYAAGKLFFLFAARVKTQPVMNPQWFILMDKLLIYQIRFQSPSSCAKTGSRKENPFVWGRKF